MDNIPYLTIIYTRFAGPTNTQGSRIIASSNSQVSSYNARTDRVLHPYLHEYSGEENHKTGAFKYLGKRFGEVDKHNFELLGISDTGNGMAFIFKRVGV